MKKTIPLKGTVALLILYILLDWQKRGGVERFGSQKENRLKADEKQSSVFETME